MKNTLKHSLAITLGLVACLVFSLTAIRLEAATTIPSCGKTKALFSRYPVDMRNITSITPLGNLNPQSGHVFPTDHIYFYIKKLADNETPKQINVYAPSSVWVTSVSSSTHLSADPVFTDYDIEFSPCQEFTSRLGHVTSLSSKLKKAFDKVSDEGNCSTYRAGEEEYRRCTKTLSLKFRAGEKLGTAGGRVGQNALDITAVDERGKGLAFANLSRWYTGRTHYSCFINYYPKSMTTRMRQLLGSGYSKRTTSPLCGKVAQDIYGTAQGVWFVKGTNGTEWQEDEQLALVHDNIDPTIGAFSTSHALEALGFSARAYYFVPKKTGYKNLDFKYVTKNKMYCYETGYGVLLIKLKSKNTLRIGNTTAAGCSGNSWQFKDYIDFVR